MRKSFDVRKVLFLLTVGLFWFAQYTYIPFFTPHLTGLGFAATMVGTIVGTYGFVQLVLRIPLGVLADLRREHKLFIGMGLLALSLAGVILQFAQSPVLYMLARGLAGLAASTWVSFTVFFSGYYSSEETSKAMGLIMAFNNGGMLLSYIVSGLLYEPLGINALFLLSTLSALAGFVLLLFTGRTAAVNKNPVRLGELVEVIKNKRLWNYSLLAALSQLVCFATAMSFTSNIAKDLGAGGVELGIISGVFTAAGLIASSFISTGWAVRIGDKTITLIGFLLMGVYCVAIPLCGSLWAIYLWQFVGGLGRSFIMTLMMSSAIRFIVPEKKSTAMGIYQSIYSLGMTVGPMLMGTLIDLGSGSYLPAYLAMAVLSVGGVVWAAVSHFGEKKSASRA